MSSLMYRAHFALLDTVRAPGGFTVGALFGYLEMVTRLLTTRRPGEVVHAYDHDWRPIERTRLYANYKAHRPPDPEGLPDQFDLLRGLLDSTGMTQAQTSGWEAEDTIGALVMQAEPADLVEMVSGDRDLIQLVRDADPPVRLLYTVRGVSQLHVFDEAAVLEKYGVPASRYSEFAILRGDPSDGLPGVLGVGEKTARALVQAYGTIDELLVDAAADAVPRQGPLKGSPKLRARLRDATGYLDAVRRIVPVNAEAPVTVWSGERDDEALRTAADELGLRGPVQRLIAALDSLPSALREDR